MGFTDYEKTELETLIRDDITELRKQQLSPSVYEFIRGRNLFRQVSDYARFPLRRFRLRKAENIELTKFLDDETTISGILDDLGEILTFPVRIKIDASLIISDPEG